MKKKGKRPAPMQRRSGVSRVSGATPAAFKRVAAKNSRAIEQMRAGKADKVEASTSEGVAWKPKLVRPRRRTLAEINTRLSETRDERHADAEVNAMRMFGRKTL